jgi:hypothetical protein
MLISSVWRGSARAYFVLGLLLGGLGVGVGISAIHAVLFSWWVPQSAAPWIGVAVVLLAALIDLRVLSVRLPQNARQVPERVQLAGPRYGALQFGAEMGTGLRTFMTSALPHAVALCVILAVPTPASIAAGVGFASGRVLVPLARAVPGNDPEWTVSFDRFAAVIRLALAAALLTAFVLLLTTS